jgi:prepilin-type processing-associated H-X9-DG protein
MVQCQANLKMVGIATFMYCADNHNYLPQRYGDMNESIDSTSNFMEWGYYINVYDNVYAGPVVSPPGYGGKNGEPTGSGYNYEVTKWLDPGANVGRLVVAGYMGHVEVSRKDAAGVYTNDYSYIGNANTVSSYQSVPDTGRATWRFCPYQGDILDAIAAHWWTSYIYNPQYAISSGAIENQVPGADGPETAWYRKISQMPSYACLSCDFIYSLQQASWHPTGGGIVTVNVLFPDGHVQGVQDKFTPLLFARNGIIGPQGNVGTKISTTDDVIDILLTESQGLNPVRVATVYGRYSNGATPAAGNAAGNATADGLLWPREKNVPQHIFGPGGSPVAY